MSAKDWIEINLPDRRAFTRFIGWGLGRLTFSGFLLVVRVTRATCKLGMLVCDMTEQSAKNLLTIYDQLPYMGTPSQRILEASAVTMADEPEEIITDIVSAIEGKQCMIIGEMGTGKSTIAEYLAYTVGGRVTVYECEGTPDNWRGLDIIGRGEDWAAIDEGMQADLEDLSNQMKIRNEKGDAALNGSERVYIVEEFPELVSKVSSSGEWLERHARRGRKARRFTVLLSQYDRVAAWGLEGKSDLADAFFRLRLGKKAVSHAKSLKNEALVDWLSRDRSHCLLDDQPCKLPSYREMRAVIPRLQVTAVSEAVVTAEIEPESGIQPLEPPQNQPNETLARAVKSLLEAGYSESRVIKEVLGFQGSQYQAGKSVLQSLKEH